MRGIVLARSRAAGCCALAALAAGLGGCSAAGTSTVTVSGKTLVIYAGVQPADVLQAEQLAFQQAGGQVGQFKVEFRPLAGAKLSDNARTAIEDTNAIAYLGEAAPGASADTIGITNDLDLLQLSPTDTALELTQSTAAVSNSPSRYYEAWSTYKHTFARVVPSAALEAKAQVQQMQTLGVKQLYVADDGSAYGQSIALAVRQAAAPGITVVPSRANADAIFYGGVDRGAAVAALNAAAGPAVKLFAPSSLDDQQFASALSAAAQRDLYVSAPGFTTKQLPTQATAQFVTPFKAANHHAPSAQAIFGYEAMSALLTVLKSAGASANNRDTVVHDFLLLKRTDSVLGAYSIDANGDAQWTGAAPFVFSRVRSGRLVQLG
jgi:branched-chain amino acid transport system substrate-binding protein